MSLPDRIAVVTGDQIPTRFPTHPHSLALLPVGVSIDEVGAPGQQFCGVFLVDPDCAGIALNDSALDGYIKAKRPIFIHAARARDLRPFFRRAEQFGRRGVVLEVLR